MSEQKENKQFAPITTEDLKKEKGLISAENQYTFAPLPKVGPQVRYDVYLPESKKANLTAFEKTFLSPDQILIERAKNQPWYEQVAKGFGNILPNVFLGLGEMAGLVGELASYGINEITGKEYKADFSNALTETMNSWKDPLGKVYQEDPTDVFDWSDPAWYINNTASLFQSIIEFGATGFGIGSLAKAGIGAGVKALQAGVKSAAVARGIAKGGDLAATAITSASLGYLEGGKTGAPVYNEVFNQKYAETGDYDLAVKEASEAAATTVKTNTALIGALSTTAVLPYMLRKGAVNQAKRFGLGIKPGESVKDYSKRMSSFKGSTPEEGLFMKNRIAFEAVQESAEELGNVYAEEVGYQKAGMSEYEKTGLDLFFELAKTDEGRLSMMLGALGGVGQTMMMDNMPWYKRKDKEGNMKRMSAKKLRDMEMADTGIQYAEQIAKDLQAVIGAQEELQNAIAVNDDAGIEVAKNKLFDIYSKKSIFFDEGDSAKAFLKELSNIDNTRDLSEVYAEQIAQLEEAKAEATPEQIAEIDTQIKNLEDQAAQDVGKTQAMKMGLADNKEDNEYKQKAKDKINEIDELVKEYKEIKDIYNFGDEVTAGLADYIFELGMAVRRLDDNININQKAYNEYQEKISNVNKKTDPEEFSILSSFIESANELRATKEEIEDKKKELANIKENREVLKNKYQVQTEKELQETIRAFLSELKEKESSLQEEVNEKDKELIDYYKSKEEEKGEKLTQEKIDEKVKAGEREYYQDVTSQEELVRIKKAINKDIKFRDTLISIRDKVTSFKGRADFVEKAQQSHEEKLKKFKEILSEESAEIQKERIRVDLKENLSKKSRKDPKANVTESEIQASEESGALDLGAKEKLARKIYFNIPFTKAERDLYNNYRIDVDSHVALSVTPEMEQEKKERKEYSNAIVEDLKTRSSRFVGLDAEGNQVSDEDFRAGRFEKYATIDINGEIDAEYDKEVSIAGKDDNIFELKQFVKDYILNNGLPNSALDSYTFASNEVLRDIGKSLRTFIKNIQTNKETIVDSDVFLFSEAGFASKPDLITTDDAGNFRIYSIENIVDYGKTIKPITKEGKSGTPVSIYDFKGIYDAENDVYIEDASQESLREKNQNKLSLYNIALDNSYGINAVEGFVLPIDIEYSKENEIIKSNAEDLIPVDFLSFVDKYSIQNQNLSFDIDDLKAKFFSEDVTVTSDSSHANLSQMESYDRKAISSFKIQYGSVRDFEWTGKTRETISNVRKEPSIFETGLYDFENADLVLVPHVSYNGEWIDADGNVVQKTYSELIKEGTDNVPIQIVDKKTQKVIGYLPNVHWVTRMDGANYVNMATGTAEDPIDVEAEARALSELRKRVIEEYEKEDGKEISIEIVDSSRGTLIRNYETEDGTKEGRVVFSDGIPVFKYDTATKLLPEKGLTFGIINNGQVQIGIKANGDKIFAKKDDSIVESEYRNGSFVVNIEGEYIPLQISSISERVQNTIFEAVMAKISNNKEIIEAIDDVIPTIEFENKSGIYNFLNQFVNPQNFNSKTLKAFPKRVFINSSKKGFIYVGQGDRVYTNNTKLIGKQNDNVTYYDISKHQEEFRNLLSNLNISVDLKKGLNKDEKYEELVIKDGVVSVNNDRTYNEFVKDSIKTYINGTNFTEYQENGETKRKYIYYEQPAVYFEQVEEVTKKETPVQKEEQKEEETDTGKKEPTDSDVINPWESADDEFGLDDEFGDDEWFGFPRIKEDIPLTEEQLALLENSAIGDLTFQQQREIKMSLVYTLKKYIEKKEAEGIVPNYDMAFKSARKSLMLGVDALTKMGRDQAAEILKKATNEYWEDFSKLAETYLNSIGYRRGYDSAVESEGSNYEKRKFDSSFDINQKETANSKVKMELSFIPNYDIKTNPDGSISIGNPVKNFIGLPAFIPLKDIWQKLLDHLIDVNPNIESIKYALKTSQDPSLKRVYNILVKDKDFENNFFVAFNMQRVRMSIAFVQKTEDKIKTYQGQSDYNDEVNSIINSFSENMMTESPFVYQNEEGNYVINREKVKDYKKRYEELVRDKFFTGNEAYEILSNFLINLGVNLFPNDIKLYLDNKSVLRSQIRHQIGVTNKNTFVNQVFDILLDDTTTTPDGSDVLQDDSLYSLRSPVLSSKMRNDFRELARAVIRRDGPRYSGSHSNVNKDIIYPWQKPNYLYDTILKMKSEEYQKTLDKGILTKASKLKNQNIDLFYVDGLKNKDSIFGKEMHNLSEIDIHLTNMIYFFGRAGQTSGKRGMFAFPKSDKTVVPVLDVPINRYTYRNKDKVEGAIAISNIPVTAVNDLLDYAVAEYERVLNSKDYRDQGLINKEDPYYEGSKYFFMFPFLNYQYMQNYVDQGVITEKEFDVMYPSENTISADRGAVEPILRKLINNYFTEEVNNTYNKLNSFELLGRKVEFTDRGGKITTIKDIFIGSGYIDNPDLSTKNTREENILDAVVNFVINNAVVEAENMLLFGRDPAHYWKKSIEETLNVYQKRAAKDTAPRSPGNIKPENRRIRRLVSNDINKAITAEGLPDAYYKSIIDIGDGAQFATVKFFIDTQEELGKIKPEEAQKLRDKINPGKYYEFTDEQVKKYFSPIKDVYTGEEYNSELRTFVPIYVKNATFPLLPQLLKQPDGSMADMDKVRVMMEDKNNNIDLLPMNSASKVGSSKVINIFDKQGKVRTDITQEEIINSVQFFDKNYYGLQQEESVKEARKVNLITQLDTLLFSGIRNIKDFEYRGKKYDGRTLEKHKDAILKEIYAQQKNAIYSEFGIEVVDGAPIVTDFSKLKSVLEGAAEKNQWSKHDVDALRLSEDKQSFIIPPELTPKFTTVQNLLYSSLSKIAKVTLKGKAFAQAPSLLVNSEMQFSEVQETKLVPESTTEPKDFDTKGLSLDTKERAGWKWIKLNGKNIGEVRLVKNDRRSDEVGLSIKIDEEFQNKGYGQIAHVLTADWAKNEFGDTLYSDFDNSQAEINTLLALTKKGYAEQIGDYGTEEDGRYYTDVRAFRIKTSDEIQKTESVTEPTTEPETKVEEIPNNKARIIHTPTGRKGITSGQINKDTVAVTFDNGDVEQIAKSELTLDTGEEVTEEEGAQPSTKKLSVKINTSRWTKDSPKENPDTAYVFTENINSIGDTRVGGGTAVIRNNPNAIGIVTKKYYVYREQRNTEESQKIKDEYQGSGQWYNQNFEDTDTDFELFKQVNEEQFAKIDAYSSVIFPDGFANSLAKIPTRFAEWLQGELLNRYGLVTELNESKTGLISKEVVEKETQPSAEETVEEQLELSIGRYVKYKDEVYIITQFNDNGTVQIYNPTKEGASAKKSVAEKNLTPINESAEIIRYKGSDYLVTPKKSIISLTTNKIMKWGPENGDRKAILALYDEAIKPKPPAKDVTEKPVGEKKFTYNGVTIDTEFPLGEEQKQALENLIDYVNTGKYEPYMIEGSAGTGKTTIIGYLEKYLKESKSVFSKNIYYGAPTHAATAQLAIATVKTGNTRLPYTTKKMFYTYREFGSNKKRTGFTARFDPLVSDGATIIVIDEASMIEGGYLEEFAKHAEKRGVKMILMGDRKQIPSPDKQSLDKEGNNLLNKYFDSENRSVLNKVYRQDTSDLLDNLNQIKENKFFNGTITISKNDGTVQVFDRNSFNKLLIDSFKEDPENNVYIAYTNKRVKELNEYIKKKVSGTDKLVNGDLIVGYLGSKIKQITAGQLANSVAYVVEDIERKEGTSIVNISASSKLLSSLSDAGIEGVPKTSYSQYVQLNMDDSLIYEGITQEEMDKTNENISNTLKHYYEKYKAYKKQRRWKDLRDLETAVTKFFDRYDFGNKYYYDPASNRLVTNPTMNENKARSIFSVDKGVDYGYAITAHKSQGMTVKNAFLDVENIAKSGNTRNVVTPAGDVVHAEKNAIYYVGMSRSKNVFIVENPYTKIVNSEGISGFPSEYTPEPFIDESLQVNVGDRLVPRYMPKDKVSGMVYTKSYNPAKGLQYFQKKDGKVQYAQVMVPWDFKDSQGNLLNIDLFTDENGAVDFNKLPQEVLRAISSRIPNQGHSSMLPFEIVGFIPSSMGKTIIVPDGITLQMGSDFDIDKLYSYLPDYYYDYNTNSIKLLSIEADLTDSDAVYEEVFGKLGTYAVKAGVKRAIQNYNSFKDIDKDIAKFLHGSLKKFLTSKQLAILTEMVMDYEVNDSYISLAVLDKLPDENTFKLRSKEDQSDLSWMYSMLPLSMLRQMYLDIHKSVMTHPEVFDKIVDPLENNDIETEKQLIGKKSGKIKTTPISPLSYINKTNNVIDKWAGASLVGISAIGLTTNAVIEDKGIDLVETTPYGEVPYSISVEINGKVLELDTLSGQGTSVYNGQVRTKQDNLKAFVTTAVDNANENQAGFVNFNPYTAGVGIVMAMLQDKNNNALSMDYILRFLSQDIINMYLTEFSKLSGSMNTEFKKNKHNSAVTAAQEKLFVEYLNKTVGYDPSIDLYENQWIGKLMERALALPIPNKDVLLKMINGKEDFPVMDYYANQLAMLYHFDKLKKISEELIPVRKGILNPFVDQLPTNIYDVMEMADNYEKVKNGSTKLSNLPRLIYDIDEKTGKRVPSTRGAFVAEAIINPVYSISSSVFPVFGNLLNKIEAYYDSRLNMSDSGMIPSTTKRKLWNETVSYMWQHFEEFGLGKLNDRRAYLFYELPLKLAKLKNTPWGKQNIFLQKLDTELSEDSKKPSFIKYQALRSKEISDQDIVAAIVSLLKSNDPQQRELIQDLYEYAMISGATFEPRRFMHVLPSAWFEAEFTGIFDKIKEISSRDIRIKTIVHQITRNRTDLLETFTGFNNPNIRNRLKVNTEGGKITGLILPPVTSLQPIESLIKNGNYISQFKIKGYNGEELILEHVGSYNIGGEEYAVVSRLGYGTVPEYFPGVEIPSSFFNTGGSPKVKSPSTENVIDIEEGPEFTAEQQGDNLINDYLPPNLSAYAAVQKSLDIIGDNDYYKDIASVMRGALKKKQLRIVKSNSLPSLAAYKENTIYFNPKMLGEDKVTHSQFQQMLLHEYGHAITNELIARYKNPKLISSLTKDQISLIKSLENVYKAVVKKLSEGNETEFAKFQKKMERVLSENSDETLSLSAAEVNWYYVRNFEEFAASVWKEDFQEVLNEIPYDSKRTFKDRVLDLINKIIRSLSKVFNIEVKDGMALKEALSIVIDLTADIPAEIANDIDSEKGEDNVIGYTDEGAPIFRDIESGLDDMLSDMDGYPKTGDPQSFSAFPAVSNPALSGVVFQTESVIKDIKSNIASTKGVKERKRLQNLLSFYEQKLQQINSVKTPEELLSFGQEQLEYARSIMERKNSTDKEYLLAISIIDSWDFERTRDFLPKVMSVESNPWYKALSIAGTKRDRLEGEIINKLRSIIAKSINKKFELPKKLTVADIAVMKDLKNYYTALDASVSGVPILQYLNRILRDKQNRANSELTKVTDDIESKIRELGFSKGDFDFMFQLDSEGKSTGRIIHEYTAEYDQKMSDIYANFYERLEIARGMKEENSKQAVREAVRDFHKERKKINEIIDIREIISEEKSSKYIKYLEKEYGKEKAKEIVEVAKRKYAEYELEREMFIDNMKAEIESVPVDLIYDSIKGESIESYLSRKIDVWEKENSPIVALDKDDKNSMYEAMEIAQPGKPMGTPSPKQSITNKGDKYLLFVPRKTVDGVKTNYYSTAYNNLTENQIAWLEYFSSFIMEMKKNFPVSVQNSMPNNFYPTILKDTASEMLKNQFGRFVDQEITKRLTKGTVSFGDIKEDRTETEERRLRRSNKLGDTRNLIKYVDTENKINPDDISKNVELVMKRFAEMAIFYKHKNDIESEALLINRIIQGSDEIDIDGNLIPRSKSLMNIKKQAEHMIKSGVYDQKADESNPSKFMLMDGFNILQNNKKRRRLKEIQKEYIELERKLLEEEILYEDYEQDVGALEIEYNMIGGKPLVMSRVLQSFLELNQLKHMGWNIRAGFANMGFGMLSVFTWSAGNPEFTTQNVITALGIMMRSGTKRKDLKVANVIKKMNVLFEVRDVTFGRGNSRLETDVSKLKFISKNISAFEIQRKTEYFVQGLSMLSQMINTQVEVTRKDTGEVETIPLFYALDENGDWNTEIYEEQKDWDYIEGDKMSNFRNKVIKTNYYMHGNYDPDNLPMFKRSVYMRALFQFRSWIPYGFAQRFIGDYYDPDLGRNFKGRYRTYSDIGVTKSLKGMMSILFSNRDKANEKLKGENIEDIDIANLRMNLRELQILAGLIFFGFLIKSAMPDDDEDEEFVRGTMQILVNQLYRIEQDIYFYVSLNTLEDILRNPVPVFKLYIDYINALSASIEYLSDPSGYEKDSPLKKFAKANPGSNQVVNIMYSATNSYRDK